MGSLVCLQAQDEFTAAESPEQAPHTSTGTTHSHVPAYGGTCTQPSRSEAPYRELGAGGPGQHGMENAPGAHRQAPASGESLSLLEALT